MKKSILLIVCLLALFTQHTEAQDLVGDLFKVEADATDIEHKIAGTFHLKDEKGKLTILVYNLQMKRLGSIYDYVISNDPYNYSFDSSKFDPGIHVVIFIYQSYYGGTEVAHYKVLK